LLYKITGHSAFEVDESFVMEEIGNEINEEERELLSSFIDQSQEKLKADKLAASQNKGFVSRAYYRICGVPTRQCDDSPLEDIEFPSRITSRQGTLFGHKGKHIHTDGKRCTKLTKVYKRDDNRGALQNALKRMKLNF